MNFADDVVRNDKLLFEERNKIIKIANDLRKNSASYDFFRNQTAKFKKIMAQAETKEEQQIVLDRIYQEAYATCYLAIEKTARLTPREVQVEGALVMKDNNIAEMKTGEGKTLTGLFPIYLKALTGRGVHVMTSNNYLSERDYADSKPFFDLVGLSVGLLPPFDHKNKKLAERRRAYQADVTYGEVREFNFDDMRDKLAMSLEDQVCVGRHGHAVMDEIDSTLLDDGVSPCVINRPVSKDENKEREKKLAIILQIINYPKFWGYTAELSEEQFPSKKRTLDFLDPQPLYIQTSNSVEITQRGSEVIQAAVAAMGYQIDDNYMADWEMLFKAALYAKGILKEGINYEVVDGSIKLLQLSTGRLENNKHFQIEVQQALETKHGVPLSIDGINAASTTYPVFLSQYDSISGMTGTAYTAKDEFAAQYGMGIRKIRENIHGKLKDDGVIIYATKAEKVNAIVSMTMRQASRFGRPVLIGTISTKCADLLDRGFQKFYKSIGLKSQHQVLSATQSEREAEKIKAARLPGAVTIATGMGGRGANTILPKISARAHDPNDPAEAGMLVLLSEYYLDERVRDQFVGRAARQGQPGSTITILSLEDDVFASQPMLAAYKKFAEEGEPISGTAYKQAMSYLKQKRELHTSQKRNLREISNHNGLLENEIKKAYYEERQKILNSSDLTQELQKISEKVGDVVSVQISNGDTEAPVRICSTLGIKDHSTESVERVVIEKLNEAFANLNDYNQEDVKKKLLITLDESFKQLLMEIPQIRLATNTKTPGPKDKRDAAYLLELYKTYSEIFADYIVEFATSVSVKEETKKR